MFSEDPIRKAMAAWGFARIKRLTYLRSSHPNEVRHFVYFSRWGSKKEYLTAVYGLGNLAADNFAVKCVSSYGGKVYKNWERDRSAEVITRLSLGRLAEWEPRDSIEWQAVEKTALISQIDASVRLHLMPIIDSTNSRTELLHMLLADSEPCRWAFTNAATRAAQIVYLALQTGADMRIIRGALLPFAKNIAAQITSGWGGAEYIDRVIEDARSENTAAVHEAI